MAYPYVPAYHQWPRRAGYSPKVLVIHSMEAPEKGTTAESCANFFKNGSGGRTASAHLCIDDNSVVQCVPYDRKAAGAAGGPYRGAGINDSAIHIEHAGYARQTAGEWADDFSRKMLFWSSLAAADICKRYSIPAVRLSPHELRNGYAGICTHRDITDAFFVYGGHTDPGPNFPMNSYIANVNYWLQIDEEDMFTDEDRRMMLALVEQVKYLTHVQDDIIRPKLDEVYLDTHADDHKTTLAGRVKGTAEVLGVPTT